VVLAKKVGATDTVRMTIDAIQDSDHWQQEGVEQIEIPVAANWEVVQGWNALSFPIGTHDNDLWAAGNFWRIRIYASITGAAAWDELRIAGVYLVPLDDSYLMSQFTYVMVTNCITSIKDLDGDRGVYFYDPAATRYYSNIGAVGIYPSLAPEVENWLYLIMVDSANEVDITDAVTASITYRPQGIFLRGTNP